MVERDDSQECWLIIKCTMIDIKLHLIKYVIEKLMNFRLIKEIRNNDDEKLFMDLESRWSDGTSHHLACGNLMDMCYTLVGSLWLQEPIAEALLLITSIVLPLYSSVSMS
ncbi:unnamed protein product [Sphenostylis stenocarpa]|uniref:Uncharacterized protein n=1 Tax=Sphenostylis stenocarpa TaxID=92480 RepID=A0AA86SGC9_9FABA|nr:unnamed protein product [Sphenostylis stenocarpa]